MRTRTGSRSCTRCGSAGSSRSATGGWCRFGLAESGGESLLWCPEAKAFAGCGVHACLDLVQAGRGEGGEVELARQEAAQPAVGVLDAALLPRRVRVAEVTVDAAALGQLLIAEELRAAVEGDGLACGGWQLGQYLADGADHTGGTPVVVWHKPHESARALHERGQVGLAVGAAEDQQVRLPMTDGLALTDLGRPLGDGPFGRDLEAARLTAEASAPQPSRAQEMAVQLERATFRAVDELVDGLVAQAAVLASELQAAGDLLGRPAELQFLNDMTAQAWIPDELALPTASAPGAVLGGDGIVAAVLLHLAELVAGDLAVDGRAVPTELACDLLHRQLGIEQPEECTALLQGEVSVAAFHPRPHPKPLSGLGSRTSEWNAPRAG